MAMDRDRDGRISRQELPAQLRQRPGRMDSNGDGFVDRAEADEAEKRFRRQQNSRPPR